VAQDLVGKPADVVIAENYTLLFAVRAEIASLKGRSYVVDVAVSRYSFLNQDICFQVLKFYPKGSSIFGLEAALLAAGKPAVSLVRSVSSSLEQGSGSDETSLSCAQCSISSFVQHVTYCCWSEGSADKGEQAGIPAMSADVGQRTPPPAAILLGLSNFYNACET
jgi:hypothetical protein